MIKLSKRQFKFGPISHPYLTPGGSYLDYTITHNLHTLTPTIKVFQTDGSLSYDAPPFGPDFDIVGSPWWGCLRRIENQNVVTLRCWYMWSPNTVTLNGYIEE